jgi:glycosyltransferase involved in cell wall biosynthesis
MSDPEVSIVILNYNNPEVIDVCLRTLHMTEGVPYEVVVVDNGSPNPDMVPILRGYRDEGLITTLVENSENAFFSEGNNIGVRASNPNSKYILLLNSDVGFLRPDWLLRLVEWMEGTAKWWPSVWGLRPSIPREGPRDLVSCGWSHDATVEPGHVRPEGWCFLMRREWWREISPDFPWLYGIEEMQASAIREGAKCGVLFNYAPYLVHREGGSGKSRDGAFVNKRVPDIPGWFNGLDIETIDFKLGPDEHSSYICW